MAFVCVGNQPRLPNHYALRSVRLFGIHDSLHSHHRKLGLLLGECSDRPHWNLFRNAFSFHWQFSWRYHATSAVGLVSSHLFDIILRFVFIYKNEARQLIRDEDDRNTACDNIQTGGSHAGAKQLHFFNVTWDEEPFELHIGLHLHPVKGRRFGRGEAITDWQSRRQWRNVIELNQQRFGRRKNKCGLAGSLFEEDASQKGGLESGLG